MPDGGRLSGERALVTGATGGLGKVVARMLAEEGATVACAGRDASKATDLPGPFLSADLGSPEAAQEVVAQAADALGGLTALVTCHVAHMPDGAVDAVAPHAWEEALRVDLSSVAWLCAAAVEPMRDAGRGSMVLVSSRAAVRGSPGHAAYTAAKGGLNALARSIAVDFARDAIRCSTISAGYLVHAERDRDLDTDANRERRERLEAMHLTRLGRPEDVGHAVVYLVSRESEFVTGIDLPVDGGSTIARASSFR